MKLSHTVLLSACFGREEVMKLSHTVLLSACFGREEVMKLSYRKSHAA